jgi:hypothetical protein
MSDAIILNTIPEFPPIEKATTNPNYIKHVICDGARFHVIHWDSNGEHCSETKCIINKGKINDKSRKDRIRRRSRN